MHGAALEPATKIARLTFPFALIECRRLTAGATYPSVRILTIRDEDKAGVQTVDPAVAHTKTTLYQKLNRLYQDKDNF